MQIGGEPVQGGIEKRVELPRVDGPAIFLTLTPLGLGFHRELRRRGFVVPQASCKVARGADGKPLRDENGLAIQVANKEEGRFQELLEEYHQRIAVMVVWEALRADEAVTFEAAVPDEIGDWILFADQIWDELKAAGLTAGDLIWLCDQVSELSNLSGDHLRNVREHFFSEAP